MALCPGAPTPGPNGPTPASCPPHLRSPHLPSSLSVKPIANGAATESPGQSSHGLALLPCRQATEPACSLLVGATGESRTDGQTRAEHLPSNNLQPSFCWLTHLPGLSSCLHALCRSWFNPQVVKRIDQSPRLWVPFADTSACLELATPTAGTSPASFADPSDRVTRAHLFPSGAAGSSVRSLTLPHPRHWG